MIGAETLARTLRPGGSSRPWRSAPPQMSARSCSKVDQAIGGAAPSVKKPRHCCCLGDACSNVPARRALTSARPGHGHACFLSDSLSLLSYFSLAAMSGRDTVSVSTKLYCIPSLHTDKHKTEERYHSPYSVSQPLAGAFKSYCIRKLTQSRRRLAAILAYNTNVTPDLPLQCPRQHILIHVLKTRLVC